MVVLIDNSNLININYAAFVRILKEKNGLDYVIKEDDLGLFWHLYIRKIRDYLCNYENIIFCGEGHNSTVWRKSLYPLYKENRKDRAENPDYKFIGKCYKDTEEFLKMFHCKVMRVENCEADDVIYKLSEYFTNKGEQINIISSDKDLTQICNYFDGVSVFNPMSSVNKKCVAVVTAENCNKNILLEKIIIGDNSDNIKGLPKVGPKTLEKMLTDKAEWNKQLSKPGNQELYNAIEQIVDLRKFPKEYQDAIINYFESFDYYSFDVDGVEKFLFDHNLNQCLREWNEMSSDIQMMLAGNSSKSAEDEILELINS